MPSGEDGTLASASDVVVERHRKRVRVKRVKRKKGSKSASSSQATARRKRWGGSADARRAQHIVSGALCVHAKVHAVPAVGAL
jgi:hypothetical protein